MDMFMKITEILENSNIISQAIEFMKVDQPFELSVKDTNQFISSISDVLEMIEDLALLVKEQPNEKTYINTLVDTTKALDSILNVYLGAIPTNH